MTETTVTTSEPTDDDAFWAAERASDTAKRGRHADPSACGTCRDRTAHGGQVEHEQCAQRATLLQAPDHPGYELITGLTEAEVHALPARFHVPVFMESSTPNLWVCAVCWGEGWTSQWPCQTAQEHGADVFTPEHDAEQQQARTTAELVALRDRVAELEAAADLVAEYRVQTKAGQWLSVRRQPDGDRWSISTSHRVDGERLVWVGGRWRVRARLGFQEMWEHGSADAALAEATRLAETAVSA